MALYSPWDMANFNSLMWHLEDGYIDSHCHLADPRVGNDVYEFLARARKRGVENFLLAGIHPKDWEEQKALAAKERGIIPCFGIHPYWIDSHSPEECNEALEILEKYSDQSFGLGEMGLDFRAEYIQRGHHHQIEYFLRQWNLAQRMQKIPILHLVRCHEQALKLFKKENFSAALVHAFDSHWENAKAYLDLGFYLSVGGRILRHNNRALHEAIRKAPIERILVESDSPDQAPPQFQGKKNEPWTIVLVAERIAELKNTDAKAVLEQARHNFKTLFAKELKP